MPANRRDLVRNLSAAACLSILPTAARGKDGDTNTTTAATLNVRSFGARGDGLADDTASIAAAMAEARKVPGQSIYFPPGLYLLSSSIQIPSNTIVSGSGSASALKATVSDTHMLVCSKVHDVSIGDLKFVGRAGSTVLSHSAVLISESSDCAIRNCEVVGLSGMALRVTKSHHVLIEKNYIHHLTAGSSPANQNSADIALYWDTSHCIVRGNRCMGGEFTWMGISVLLNGTNHVIANNEVGPHYAYGILDYDLSYVITNNIISNNRISGIDGGALAGISGAGIYVHCTGGQIISGNDVASTNLNTSGETLAPGAIGINDPSTTVTITDNVISNAKWYGIYSAATKQLLIIKGNTVRNSSKDGIFLKETSNAAIDGNTVIQMERDSKYRCIGVNVSGSTGPFENVSIRNNKTIGGRNAIEIHHTNRLLLTNNHISQCTADGMTIRAGDGGAVTGNVIAATGTSGARGMIVADFANCSVSGNSIECKSPTAIYVTGLCPGSRVDASNTIVGLTPASILNASTGGVVSNILPRPSTTFAAVGDYIRNSNPQPGMPKGWFCIASGGPATWVEDGPL